MLCGKIIITNENWRKIQQFLDSKNKNNFLDFTDMSVNFTIDTDIADENLYDVSLIMAEYISKVYIRKDIYRYIENNFTCFNGDEKKIICSCALNSEKTGELAGRIYIYLKSVNSINLPGFYKFMCTDVLSCVYSTVTEEAERLLNLNDTQEFIDILKYFASMSPISTSRVDIVSKKDSIKIVNTSFPNDTYNTEFASLDPIPDDILSELVTLNPEKIVVHGREFYEKSEVSSIINGVFKDRIIYCDGCALCFDE